jgi:HK97 family phage prohead protease
MNSQPSASAESVRTTLHTEIREPAPSPGGEGQGEGGTAVLHFVASDESLDRYNEIISASGWKLDNYKRNPVFQNAHQYGDVIFTLGKALTTEVRTVAGRKALHQTIQFACDINPMAKIAYGLYKGKFLNAVSVGFVPLRWEDGSQEDGYTRKYLEQELLEVSAVGIPANPNALALGLKSGAIEKSDLRDLSELIHLTLDRPTRSPNLLQIARSLHSLLKS